MVPFAALSLVQLALLFSYVLFTSSAFVWISPRVIAALGGEILLHYPAHLLALPEAMVWSRTLAWVGGGFALVGIGGDRVFRRLSERVRVGGLGAERKAVPLHSLFLVTVVYCALLVGLHWLFTHAGTAPVLSRFPWVWVASDALSGPLLTIALAGAWVAMGEKPGVMSGFAGGARTVVGDPAVSLMAAAAVAVLASPFQLLASGVESFVESARPGTAVLGAVAALAWDAPLRVLLFASAMSLVFAQREDLR
jgi:hypothetical protein